MRDDDYVISLSGGLASAACAFVAKEAGFRFSMTFADTTIEDEDLYRFVDDVERTIGQEVIRLKDGRDPWQVFVDRKYIGNTRLAHCSRDLKTAMVKRWMDDNVAPSTKLVLGMYRDEEDRLITADQNWFPYPVISLLIAKPVSRYGGPLWTSLSPADVEDMICRRYGIRMPRLYSLGFPHNNCGGFCVRAGQGQFATLLARIPQLYAWHEERQEWAMREIGSTARPFIRVTRNYETQYLTLRQFREQVEAGTLKPAMYEMGGCGCFVDDEPMDIAA